MAVPYKDAAGIELAERDCALDLNRERWPAEAGSRPPGWRAGRNARWLSRTICNDDEAEEEKDRKEKENGAPDQEEGAPAPEEEAPEPEDGTGLAAMRQMAGPLKESILRFPSAPIHGLHRLHEYHVNEGESENFHSYRVLSHPERKRGSRIRRIFLMHNGLNETQSMGLYYRLASYLIHRDPDRETACLLRPFPGHLTRSRFSGFAETPLDHYLWDGSHLFRQFLRYMIETQWLLSAIARRSQYRCFSGLNLLAEHSDKGRSRLEDAVLAKSIAAAWSDLHMAASDAVEDLHAEQVHATSLREPPPRKSFDQAIASLRSVLGLKDRLDGDRPPDANDPDPDVHVIGYSLGGFMAQSVFMSWPFLVSSCSTLLSGGALRQLAPTAFADPEEWQTVLHSLRYELDDAMLSGRYQFASERDGKIEKGQVSGIEFDLFLFLKSTFYEVFQQEYRGSFQTRLASFRRRMLFVVGGNDPIVRPQSVLDSGPPDGINMLAIGRLGHFLGAKSRDEEEEQQRAFWLPEIGRLVGTVADEAATTMRAERRENWLDESMSLPDRSQRVANGGNTGAARAGRLNATERLAVDGDGALSAELFQRSLDDLLARADARRGILFILRNEVPTMLLDDSAIQQLAVGLHHDDATIARYIDGLKRRQRLVLDNPERVCLVLPWNTKLIMENMDAHPGHPSQSEGAGGQMPERVQPRDTWRGFRDRCSELATESPVAIRICDGRIGVGNRSGVPPVNTAALAAAARNRLNIGDPAYPVKPSLPDCWVWMSPEFLALDIDETLAVEEGRARLCKVVPDEYGDEDVLSNRLRRDQLRIVTVSRARYNPRFRGRIVVDPRVARTLLQHITLCIAVSIPFDAEYLEAAADGDREPAGV
jgi:hypothetical protein